MVSAAPICKALLRQATQKAPNRRTASDGILSSDAHQKQNPSSDHDFGNAVDLTDDPARGMDAHKYARELAAKRHPWVKYIISNGRIWSLERYREGWRPYNGSNPHEKHIHISIYSKYRGDIVNWFGRSVEETMAKLDQEDLDNIDKIVAKHFRTIIGNPDPEKDAGTHVSLNDLLRELRKP